MSTKVCDFCFNEYKGLFTHTETLPDGHIICRSCRQKIESYGMRVKYDLFQLLVTADPKMREVIMSDYLESHSVDETRAAFFPDSPIPLHAGEHLINQVPASIAIDAALIPQRDVIQRIAGITKKDVSNLYDVPNGTEVKGTIYETDAAFYFLSKHFINVHRRTNIVHSIEDLNAIHILERGHAYTYKTPHTDLFFMRDTLHRLMVAKEKTAHASLIYLSSDNTMTLMPGIYMVPKNVRPGTYFVSPASSPATLQVRDAQGRIRTVADGELDLDEGSLLEVTGSYEFRIHERAKHSVDPSSGGRQ